MTKDAIKTMSEDLERLTNFLHEVRGNVIIYYKVERDFSELKITVANASVLTHPQTRRALNLWFSSYFLISLRQLYDPSKQTLSLARFVKTSSQNVPLLIKNFKDSYYQKNLSKEAISRAVEHELKKLLETDSDNFETCLKDRIEKDIKDLGEEYSRLQPFIDKKVAHRDKREAQDFFDETKRHLNQVAMSDGIKALNLLIKTARFYRLLLDIGPGGLEPIPDDLFKPTQG